MLTSHTFRRRMDFMEISVGLTRPQRLVSNGVIMKKRNNYKKKRSKYKNQQVFDLIGNELHGEKKRSEKKKQ